MKNAALLFALLIATALATRAKAVDSSATPSITPEQTQYFESKVRPILVEHCYKCHSDQAEHVKGGLLLDTREGCLKGGDTGPAVVPGDPKKSLLIKAVSYTDSDLQMPPKNEKLSDADIDTLVKWIESGAADPRTSRATRLTG